MSDFRPMTECKGFNMERVLLKNKNGYMITAYFKDGMLQCDGDEDWTQPIVWDSFIRLQDLANGAPTSDSDLDMRAVSNSVCHYSPCLDQYKETCTNGRAWKTCKNRKLTLTK